MSVTRDMRRAWARPGAVMRDHLARGADESRALGFLMIGCFVVFIAQWPRLARESQGFGLPAEAVPPDIQLLMTYALFAWMIVVPLLFYGIAAISWLPIRAVRRDVPMARSRLALFWAHLASSPAALLWGLTVGFLGTSVQSNLTGAIWIGAFFWIWLGGLRAAVRAAGGQGAPA
ncbi:MAG: hypothetical protein ACU0BF_07380 [Paracoccaceae bacterium]